jgi:1-acyl-sn-glycerol-3-phosphate acyltransferase
MFYGIARSTFRGIMSIFYRWQVIGAENVPAEGPVLVCSNHISNWDPIVVGSGFTHRMVHFLAKESLFKVPVLSWIVRDFGAFPIKRGAGDRGAIRAALAILSEGKAMGIFPEGTRQKTGKLGEAQPGAAMFALRSGAAVVPAAIIGPYKMFTRRLVVVYGKPIDLSAYAGQKHTVETTREVSDLIMKNIADLIAEHSR